MNNKFFNWFLLIILALIWGSSFILMKRGLDAFTWDQVAAYRIFIAFVFILPFTFKHLKKEFAPKWKAFLGMGMFGNFIPAFLFTKAETVISSALTGMLNSLTPLFTLLLGVIFFKAKTRMINVVGVLIGWIGALGLVYAGAGNDLTKNIMYGGFVLIATISYGFSVNVIKQYLNFVNAITATVWALCFIGPLAGIYLFSSTDFVHRLQTDPIAWQSLGYVSILGIVGTAISVMLFNMLVKNTTTLFASSVTYLIPIVAIAWGFADKEHLVFLHIIGILFILSGVYLVNRKPA